MATACKTKQPLVTVPLEETEYRALDTLVVSAPKSDKLKAEEEYKLPDYNPSHTRQNDLLHTKLDLHFDWEKEQVIGKATLTLKPHFYPTNTLTLDAKNFHFNKIISLDGGRDLDYQYDGELLTINLGKEFKRDQEYGVFIDYVADPKRTIVKKMEPNSEGDLVLQIDTAATSRADQGLYFINPKNEVADKPQQIWTQGETEWNSRWFPTIDKPNERCTQEMYLTVEERFETLSNGLLVSSTNNGDGTRTDYWNMDMPHAPYLFMITIGEYAVVKDEWKGKPVDYYVEAEYEPFARDIFPYTPEMLTFFSDILGVEYPWQKYSQVVVRDYVSGAMENTTGVIFGEFMQGTDRELIDELANEKVVAHEMFHHWFGDYVTCESWANLTMNEGFANYSEYLWMEHKYGSDAADFHLLQELEGYAGSAAQQGVHPLIHFAHEDKEDMFDAHSYNKGGLILHMLRSYIGDEAFFAGLRKYLQDNKLSDVESHELRLAFEDVTGQDLNWFFNQWYFEQGHPELEIEYGYDAIAQEARVTVKQIQNPQRMPAIFEMSVAIDIYDANGKKTRHQVRVNERIQTFSFEANSKPELINFDAEKILLCEKIENKTEAEYMFQYRNAPKFLDRFEALEGLEESENPAVAAIFFEALQDPFWALRTMGVENADLEISAPTLSKLATLDNHSEVRMTAIEKLGETADINYANIAKNVIDSDQAFHVIAAGLKSLNELDATAALAYASKLETEENTEIKNAIAAVYASTGDAKYLQYFEKNIDQLSGFGLYEFIQSYSKLAAQTDSETMVKTAKKFKSFAMDSKKFFWFRYGAMDAINQLHVTLNEQIDAEEDATKRSELKNKDGVILGIITQIKKAETNPQLMRIYQRFPNPPLKP